MADGSQTSGKSLQPIVQEPFPLIAGRRCDHPPGLCDEQAGRVGHRPHQAGQGHQVLHTGHPPHLPAQSVPFIFALFQLSLSISPPTSTRFMRDGFLVPAMPYNLRFKMLIESF